MGNDDFRRELNGVFDEVSGSPSPALRDRVRSAVTHAPEARGPYWIAAVAAGVIAALIVGVLFVANPGRRPNGPVGAGLPSPSASPVESPMPTPSSNPTPTATPFPECGVSFGPITQNGPVPAYVSDIRTGSHPGYDRITFTFSNGAPTNFEIRPQSNATFTQGASGQTVTLRGDSGLLVIIRGSDAHTVYNGPADIKTGYSKLVEARQVEDFEGTVQWGLGVSGTACYRVTQLTNPSRLVIDLQSA